jgi:hypothetical protein
MPSLNIPVPHHLSPDKALQRMHDGFNKFKVDYGGMIKNLQELWTADSGEFSATVMGFNVAGIIKNDGVEMIITGRYPFPGIAFKERIETQIRDAAVRILAN